MGRACPPRTPKDGVAAKKDWERVTSSRPTHDGVSSSLLARMTNIYSDDLKKNIRASGRTYEETESQVIEKRKAHQSESGKKNQEKAIFRANERDQWKVPFDKYKE